MSNHNLNEGAVERRRVFVAGLCLILVVILVGLAEAQRRQRKPAGGGPAIAEGNLPKTDPTLSGRFTFVRLRFDTSQ
ncbi:MAG: hypothetical protein EBZ36_13985, partial [Acidobacteria bacterium]|nr:hypothetical protein [Acidobacteriota bacterium]